MGYQLGQRSSDAGWGTHKKNFDLLEYFFNAI